MPSAQAMNAYTAALRTGGRILLLTWLALPMTDLAIFLMLAARIAVTPAINIAVSALATLFTYVLIHSLTGNPFAPDWGIGRHRRPAAAGVNEPATAGG